MPVAVGKRVIGAAADPPARAVPSGFRTTTARKRGALGRGRGPGREWSGTIATGRGPPPTAALFEGGWARPVRGGRSCCLVHHRLFSGGRRAVPRRDRTRVLSGGRFQILFDRGTWALAAIPPPAGGTPHPADFFGKTTDLLGPRRVRREDSRPFARPTAARPIGVPRDQGTQRVGLRRRRCVRPRGRRGHPPGSRIVVRKSTRDKILSSVRKINLNPRPLLHTPLLTPPQ